MAGEDVVKVILDFDTLFSVKGASERLEKRCKKCDIITTIKVNDYSIHAQVEIPKDECHDALKMALQLSDGLLDKLEGIHVDGVQYGTLCEKFIVKSIRAIADDGTFIH